MFLGTNGKPSRSLGIEWPASPEETGTSYTNNTLHFTDHTSVLVKPYLVSILPAGSMHGSNTSITQANPSSNPIIQARSTLSLSVSQTVEYPFAPLKLSKSPPATQYTLRLLSPGPFGKPPLFLVSSPNDRTTLAMEGTTLWMFSMKEWGAQIDELVKDGKYSEALALLDSLEDGTLANRVRVSLLGKGDLMIIAGKEASAYTCLACSCIIGTKGSGAGN